MAMAAGPVKPGAGRGAWATAGASWDDRKPPL